MSTTLSPTLGPAVIRGPARTLPPFAAAMLLALPLALFVAWPKAVTVWQTGNFFDTDDAMRAVQVRDWMAGQAWFDLAAHRLGPPEGLFMHWSRVVDVPLAALIRGFGLLLSPDLSERAARIAFPLALQVGLVAAMAYAARVLAGARAMAPAALLIVFGGIGYTQFQSGRIDHHAPQILLLTLMAATLLDSLDPARARRAALSGAAVAVTLAISLENLPFVAVLLAVLPVMWLLDGARHRRALLWLALGLGLSAPLLFAATVAPWRYPIASVDAFSAPHLAGCLLAALAFVVLASAGVRFDGTGAVGLGRRAALLGGIGVAAAAVMLAAFPHCLDGPFAGMDPIVKRLWLDHVREVQPLFAALRDSPDTTLPLIGPLAAAAAAILCAIRATRGLERRRWMALAALVAVGFGGTLWGMRVACSLQPLALLGGAWAVARTLDWARGGDRPATAVLLPFALFLACSSLAWAMLPVGGEAPPSIARASGDALCDSASAFAPLDRLPVARVFAPLDAGPFLLAHTGLSVVAGPYHRNDAGNAAVLRGFTASPAAARDIVRSTGATLVAVCPTEPPSATAPDDLLTALEAARVPDWLRPVPLEGTPYRVYAVE